MVYMGNGEVVSASTDSSLRLWSIGEGKAVRRYEGHINEKNFVGLSAEGDFVACGSETSHVRSLTPLLFPGWLAHHRSDELCCKRNPLPGIGGFLCSLHCFPQTKMLLTPLLCKT